MTKPGFHQLHSLAEALLVLHHITPAPQKETVSLENALGRILSEDLKAPIAIPLFSKSAMDGYAVLASDCYTASLNHPVRLKCMGEIFPGEPSSKKITQGYCMEIATGAPLPQGANGIVMVEYTEKEGDLVSVYKPAVPGEHIIQPGSDIKEGETVGAAGTILGPRHTAMLSGLGITEVPVYEKIKVGICSTGNEIVRPPQPLKPGQSYDINYRAIMDAITAFGCKAEDFGVVADDLDGMEAMLKRMASSCDLIILSGGSSLGSKDYMMEVVQKMGEILVHGIAVKPGKPTLIGKISGKVFLGLPGHPASALSNFFIVIQPYLHYLYGIKNYIKPMVQATLKAKIASTIGRFEYLPVKLTKNDDHWEAKPVMKGSSAISSLVHADGYLEINENIEVLDNGTKVDVFLFPS